jgi:hypothetical protein
VRGHGVYKVVVAAVLGAEHLRDHRVNVSDATPAALVRVRARVRDRVRVGVRVGVGVTCTCTERPREREMERTPHATT